MAYTASSTPMLIRSHAHHEPTHAATFETWAVDRRRLDMVGIAEGHSH